MLLCLRCFGKLPLLRQECIEQTPYLTISELDVPRSNNDKVVLEQIVSPECVCCTGLPFAHMLNMPQRRSNASTSSTVAADHPPYLPDHANMHHHYQCCCCCCDDHNCLSVLSSHRCCCHSHRINLSYLQTTEYDCGVLDASVLLLPTI